MLILTSCEKSAKKEIVIDEQRQITQFDQANFTATAQEDSASYAFQKPSGWKEQPATNFRLINFSTGSNVEVYLSESRGDPLANANRWLGQFGQSPVANLDALQPMKLLGQDGYLVKAVGPFKSFGSSTAKADYMLMGLIADVSGVLVTVKMTGPKQEVEQEAAMFIQFCNSLRSP